MIVTDQRLVDAGIVGLGRRATGGRRDRDAGFHRRRAGADARGRRTRDRATLAMRDRTPSLGLGGGSNMDLAKITATVLAHGGTPRDYFGDDCLAGPVLPLICVPTTAGTGSEVSASCVLTDRQNAGQGRRAQQLLAAAAGDRRSAVDDVLSGRRSRPTAASTR